MVWYDLVGITVVLTRTLPGRVVIVVVAISWGDKKKAPKKSILDETRDSVWSYKETITKTKKYK